MTDTTKLDMFLRTDPRDVGCERAMEVLHVYVDLVAHGGGDGPARRMPEVEAHLRACGPCNDDYEGLLAAVALMADG